MKYWQILLILIMGWDDALYLTLIAGAMSAAGTAASGGFNKKKALSDQDLEPQWGSSRTDMAVPGMMSDEKGMGFQEMAKRGMVHAGVNLFTSGTDKMINALMSKSPGQLGREARTYNQAAYPGTTPWEQLGATGAPQAIGAERQNTKELQLMQKQLNMQQDLKTKELDTQEKIALRNNETAKEIAELQTGPAYQKLPLEKQTLSEQLRGISLDNVNKKYQNRITRIVADWEHFKQKADYQFKTQQTSTAKAQAEVYKEQRQLTMSQTDQIQIGLEKLLEEVKQAKTETTIKAKMLDWLEETRIAENYGTFAKMIAQFIIPIAKDTGLKKSAKEESYKQMKRLENMISKWPDEIKKYLMNEWRELAK